MRVPAPIGAVFDKFPLVELPAYREPQEKPDQALDLVVYGVDNDGFPLDPRCLIVTALLRLKNVNVNVTVASPYISSLETLPLLINDTDRTAHSTLDYILNHYFKEEGQDPKVAVYRSLIETWLDDAWHNTIMDPAHATTRDLVYSSGDSSTQYPWPLSSIRKSTLDAHLEERFVKSRAAIDDDYTSTDGNLLRAGMTISALDEIVDAKPAVPSILDVLIFAYTWPISQLLPDSALAALLSPKLREHSQTVRSYLSR